MRGPVSEVGNSTIMNLSGLSRGVLLFLLPGACLMMLGGCVVSRQTAFNPAEFSGTTRQGTGVVTGRVSVGTIHPHSQPILLVPVTTYTTGKCRAGGGKFLWA